MNEEILLMILFLILGIVIGMNIGLRLVVDELKEVKDE